MRLEAINTLAAIGGKKALKAIERALQDKSREVREAAEKVPGIVK